MSHPYINFKTPKSYMMFIDTNICSKVVKTCLGLKKHKLQSRIVFRDKGQVQTQFQLILSKFIILQKNIWSKHGKMLRCLKTEWWVHRFLLILTFICLHIEIIPNFLFKEDNAKCQASTRPSSQKLFKI